MTGMRFHLLGFPHTQTTALYNNCAYTAKNRKWASMMTDRGHEVFLYAGEDNEARCTELVTCITREEQDRIYGGEEWYRRGFWAGVAWDETQPGWRLFNERAIAAVRERAEREDFLLLSAGWPHGPVMRALPHLTAVEPGIGYQGVLDDTRRVFESYAWMHAVYGWKGTPDCDGRFMDAVIPNYFEVDDFPLGRAEDREDYVAFLSRWTPRKGTNIAIQATAMAGVELRVAGTHMPVECAEYPHIDFVGLADRETRGRMMSRARALMCPTEYLEPFGGVVCEALLCGTPVITTDWGAFPENVRHGVDGYRCRMMREFVDAIGACVDVDHDELRANAIARWSTEAVAPMYEDYFERLLTLWAAGFYEGVRR